MTNDERPQGICCQIFPGRSAICQVNEYGYIPIMVKWNIQTIQSMLWICLLTVCSGQNYGIIHYSVSDGLSVDLAKGVIRDQQGYLWIASDNGIDRFDGQQFLNINQPFPSPYIKELTLLRDGSILAVTDEGVFTIINTVDSTHVKTVLAGNKVPSDSTIWYPKTVYEDSQYTLWFAEPDHVVRLLNGKMHRYNLPEKNATYDFLRSYQFLETTSGIILAISLPGILNRYDPQLNQFQELDLPLDVDPVFCTLHLNENTFLIGSGSGIFLLDLQANGVIRNLKKVADITNVSWLEKSADGNILVATWDSGLHRLILGGENLIHERFEELDCPKINQIFAPDNGNIWLATDIGIFLLQPNLFETVLINEQRPFIHDIRSGQSNTIFICSSAGIDHLLLLDEISKPTSSYTLSGEYLVQVAPAPGGIWVTNTLGSIIWIERQGRELSFDLSGQGLRVLSMVADENRKLWLCQDGTVGVLAIDPQGNRQHYGSERGLSGRMNCIHRTHSGEIYAAGNPDMGYLYHYECEGDRFQNISVPLPHSFSNDFQVNDLLVQDNSDIWLATTTGLVKIKNSQAEHVDLNEYTDIEISALTWQDPATLWIGSKAGLMKYQNGSMVVYDEKDGLPSKTISNRSLLTDHQNRLWAGTSNGLALAQGLDTTRTTRTPLISQIESEDIPGEIFHTDEITISPRSYLIIRYICLSYPADNIQYQTRILPEEKDWSQPLIDTELLIPRLSRGNHILEVRARQHGNYHWSIPASLTINVKPKWWESYWAILLYIIVIILFIWIIIRIYVWRYRRHTLILELQVRERTIELSQINSSLRQVIQERQRAQKELKNALAVVEAAARRDPLTGLSNRRDILEKIQPEVFRFERDGQPFSLIIADIDDFKHINDTFGHECGDLVLKEISAAILNSVRKLDVVARWGGEEFLLLLPNTHLEGALKKGEDIRQMIANLTLEYEGQPVPVTMTFGVSTFADNSSIEACIKLADQALYTGKTSGKNQVRSSK